MKKGNLLIALLCASLSATPAEAKTKKKKKTPPPTTTINDDSLPQATSTNNPPPPPSPQPERDSSEADNTKPLPDLVPGAEGEDFPNFLVAPEKWHLRIAPETHAFKFQLSGGTELDFIPNTNSLLVLGVNYTGIGGMSYGIRQPLSDSDAVKGASRYEDWRFNFPFRRFNLFLFYSRYTGFYLDNTSVTGYTAKPYLLFPNLYAQNLGAHFTWVLNPRKFSMAAMMDQTEKQIKTGASLIVGLSATETIFRSSQGSFIPVSVRSSYASDGDMYEGRVRSISARGGGGCTWVFMSNRKWSLSLLGTVGFGPQQVRVSTSTDNYTAYRFFVNQFDAHFNGGYNGEHWYSGITVAFSESFYYGQKAEITSEVQQSGFYVGTRF